MMMIFCQDICVGTATLTNTISCFCRSLQHDPGYSFKARQCITASEASSTSGCIRPTECMGFNGNAAEMHGCIEKRQQRGAVILVKS